VGNPHAGERGIGDRVNSNKREIRPYKAGDVFTIVDILSKAAKSNLKNLLVAESSSWPLITGPSTTQSGEPDDERFGRMAFEVLSECWECCGESLKKWLASLNNMTLVDFEDADPDIVLDTIEEIATRKESKDFFLKAYSLFRRIGGSQSGTENAGMQS